MAELKIRKNETLGGVLLSLENLQRTYERAAKCKQRDEYPINLPKYFDKSY